MATRNPTTGRYKKPKAHRLSPDGGIHSSPSVAWIESNQEFLVVWQMTQRVQGFTDDLLGRAVDPVTGEARGAVLVVG